MTYIIAKNTVEGVATSAATETFTLPESTAVTSDSSPLCSTFTTLLTERSDTLRLSAASLWLTRGVGKFADGTC